MSLQHCSPFASHGAAPPFGGRSEIQAPATTPRSHARIDVMAEVTMRRLGKLGFRVRLFDLSPVGCKAEFVDRPDFGEQVRIKFDGMESIEGSICWIAGAKAGVRFVRPIHDAVFASLLERLKG